MPGAAETYPPLTTVRTRVGRIARLAIDALIEGRQDAETTAVQDDLISRGTWAEVPRDLSRGSAALTRGGRSIGGGAMSPEAS